MPKYKNTPFAAVIRIEINLPGRGREAHEFEHCLIRDAYNNYCSLDGGRACKFGLTEAYPPSTCPMRSGKFKQEISMEFSIVDIKEGKGGDGCPT